MAEAALQRQTAADRMSGDFAAAKRRAAPKQTIQRGAAKSELELQMHRLDHSSL